MRNIGIIKTHKGELKDNKRFKKTGCCAMMSYNWIRPGAAPECDRYNHSARIPRSWLKKLGRDLEWVEKWRRMCRLAGFNWHIVSVNSRSIYVTLYAKEHVSGSHQLASWTTVRYMYSPYFNDIPQIAMGIYEKYKVNNLNAILIAHCRSERSYAGYFGLLSNRRSKANLQTRQQMLNTMKSGEFSVNNTFTDVRSRVEVNLKTYKLKKR